MNVEIRATSSHMVGAFWTDDAARFHCWLDENGTIRDGRIYKNSLQGKHIGEGAEKRPNPDWHPTRTLDFASAVHKPIVRAIYKAATPEAMRAAVTALETASRAKQDAEAALRHHNAQERLLAFADRIALERPRAALIVRDLTRLDREDFWKVFQAMHEGTAY